MFSWPYYTHAKIFLIALSSYDVMLKNPMMLSSSWNKVLKIVKFEKKFGAKGAFKSFGILKA